MGTLRRTLDSGWTVIDLSMATTRAMELAFRERDAEAIQVINGPRTAGARAASVCDQQQPLEVSHG